MNIPNSPTTSRQQLSSSAPNGLAMWDERQRKKIKEGPFIIGVCGGTASGKTSVCEDILKKLENKRVAIVSQDSFYCSLSEEGVKEVSKYNFDHPDAFDWPLLVSVLQVIKSGKRAEIPQYSFITNSRQTETTSLYGADVILFEGILAFFKAELRDLMDIKIFVDTDADTRLSRRVMRDISERGRTLDGVLHQYEKFVKPSFDEYIFPTKKYADVIIPRGVDNQVAINLLVQHIRSKLEERDPKRLLKDQKTSDAYFYDSGDES